MRIDLILNTYLCYKPKKLTVKTAFLDYIIDRISEPEVILDLGSYDAMQSIEFAIAFPKAKIYAFECNPANIRKCHDNIKNFKNIEIIPKAVFNKNGNIKFFPVISNPGASSLFKASGKYDKIEKYSHEEITVEAIRIDTWAKERGIKKIDLIWLDLQGAEYEALESIGNMIYYIEAMFIELELKEIYKGQKLFEDVVKFLKSKGFSMIKFHTSKKKWWGNGVFLNKNLINKS